jgi:hypothetical protein
MHFCNVSSVVLCAYQNASYTKKGTYNTNVNLKAFGAMLQDFQVQQENFKQTCYYQETHGLTLPCQLTALSGN